MGNRLGRWLLLIGACLSGLMGQYYFSKRPNYFWDGVAFYALAALLLLVLVRSPRQTGEQGGFVLPRLSAEAVVRGLVSGLGLLLGLLVVVQLVHPREDYWPVFWLWVAGIGLYLLGFVRWPLLRRSSSDDMTSPGSLATKSLGSWLCSAGWEWGLLAVILLLAAALRMWRIDMIPWTLGGDEGSQGLWARDVLEGRLPNMFGLGWLSVPNLSFYWQAAWLKLAGDDVFGLRLPWAVVGTLTVWGSYLLVRRLLDRRLAFLTAFLLATYHFHIHYSRLGSNQVADPLFVVWALYFMVMGWQGGRRWAWAASGVIAGLAFYFYAGSRQVPVILVAVLAWAALTQRDFLRAHRDDLLVMLGGFAVTVGPMALYALQHPNDFNARLNQVGIFQSGWLEREVAITGRSKLSLLIEQFRKAFFAFNFYKDRVVWYGADIPLMDFLASIFFLLGAVLSAWRVLWPDWGTEPGEGSLSAMPAEASSPRAGGWPYAVFVIWFVLVMTLGGALTENPPSSQRLVSSAVPAVFFVAVALRTLSRVLAELVELPELGRRVVVGVVALVLAVISVRYYFGPYQELWVYGSFNGEVATRLGYYLRDLGPEWQEYFFGAPRMYADFGSTPFIAKGIRLYDVREPLSGPPDFVDPSYKAVFVFLPERIHELAFVQQAYPGGVLEEVHRIGDPDGPLLFTAYKVGY
jgi:hypothetical protein